MVEIPSDISVTTRQSTEICIAEMRTDIKYIREIIDSFNSRQAKQDDIIAKLQSNCNREERWETVRDQVDDHEIRITKIERAKCPKLPVLNDHEDRLGALESTHQQDTGAQTAKRSTLEYALAGVTAFEFIIIVVQFFRVA